jgi:hypothetical protein
MTTTDLRLGEPGRQVRLHDRYRHTRPVEDCPRVANGGVDGDVFLPRHRRAPAKPESPYTPAVTSTLAFSGEPSS